MNDVISKSEALRRIENFMRVTGGNAAVQMCYEIIQNMPAIEYDPDKTFKERKAIIDKTNYLK